MVACAFLGAIPRGLVVNHVDGNKTNNSAKNLEYVRPIENTRHAIATGLMPMNQPQYRRKLQPEQIAELILLRRQGRSMSSLAKQFHVSRSTVSDMLQWGQSGFRFAMPP
jgi:hypothetical protein